MKVEKTFKRDNGYKVVVEMSPYLVEKGGGFYNIRVYLFNGNEKVWDSRYIDFINMFGKEYRNGNDEVRLKLRCEFLMQYVSKEELIEVRDELLEMMRVDNFIF